MILKETPLEGCYVVEAELIEDGRGYFYEKFNEKSFEELTGQKIHFVQDNVSKSSYGVVRGIHLQKGIHAQAKLVSCSEGRVWDIAVDLREDSPTFSKWFGIELTPENRKQLFIPRGFGHGFSVLSDTAVFSYKCDNYYNKSSEGAVLWNDLDIGVDWKIPIEKVILSEKDQLQPSFKERNF